MDQIMNKISCPRCGAENPASAFFCNNCGIRLKQNPVQPVNPGYQQPYQPVYQQPYHVYVPPKKTPGKGFGVASMVLGIIGLIAAISLLEDAILAQELYANFSEFCEGYYGYGSAFSVCYEMMPNFVMPILSIVFGFVARHRGYQNGVSTSGIVMSSIACVFLVAAVTVFIAL